MSVEKTAEVKHNCENHERCMEMIQAVLDGSATADEMAHFKSEMSTCLPCIEGHDLQKSIKEALYDKLEKKCCPQDTISKIKEKIGVAGLVVALGLIEISLMNLYF